MSSPVPPAAHEQVTPPSGVAPARFRAPEGASSAASVSLDGDWRFRLFDEAVTGVSPTDPGDGWDTVAVPGHWQLAGAPDAWPYGRPAYTNVLFPIPVDPPRVPRAEPDGGVPHDLHRPRRLGRRRPGRPALRGGRLVVRGVAQRTRARPLARVPAADRGRRHRLRADGRQPARRPGHPVVGVHLRRGPGPVVALGHLPRRQPRAPSRRRPRARRRRRDLRPPDRPRQPSRRGRARRRPRRRRSR